MEKIKYFIVLFMLYFPLISQAGIIFEDNFDSQADWTPIPSGATNDMSPAGSQIACDWDETCGDTPANWSGYKSSGLWWPPSYEPSILIDSTNKRGASGKSVTIWNESNDGGSGDGWGNDLMLTKRLGSEYTDIYVNFYLQTKSGFTHSLSENLAIKIFRIGYFDADSGDTLYQFFSGGAYGPLTLFDLLYSNTYKIRTMPHLRGDPQETDYSTPGVADTLWSSGEINDAGEFADGNYHRYTFQLKMSTGTNADGEYRFWYDGDLIDERTGIQFLYSGANGGAGWNTVSIGGNNNNHFDNNYGEQWYSIDDFTVYTELSPGDAGYDATQPGNLSASYVISDTADVNGACGSASGQSFTTLNSDSANLCSAGTVTGFTGSGPWTWGCNGTGTGTDTAIDACSASLTTVEPTCSDGIQNQDETGVDCGGSCDPCSVGGYGFSQNAISFGGGVPMKFAESN